MMANFSPQGHQPLSLKTLPHLNLGADTGRLTST
jgi:hypothetical protein